MAVVPEIILHRVMVNGFRAIRQDDRIINALFRNLDVNTVEAIKEFITKEKIHLTFNYPKIGSVNYPGISILLKNEQEAQTFLGDIMGAPPHYGMPDQELAIDTLNGHGASTSSLEGLPTKLLGNLSISSVEYNEIAGITTITLEDGHLDDLLELQENPVPCSELYTIDGSGAGQVGLILSFNGLSLDIEGRFDPQLDTSTIVDIRLAQDNLPVGEPSRVYEESATNLIRKGSNYDVQYQFSIFAASQDEVLYLYTIIKALLFSQKTFMEEQGLMALKISGSDFAPRTEFLPTELFQRVMIVNFTYPFHFLDTQEVFNDRIQVDMDVGCCSPLELEIEL